MLGDWFANALFWRPQVVLLVNERTLLPVFMPLAPASTLLDRIPAAIASVLRLHGVDESVVDAELAAMSDVRIAPTNNRSVVGVMNEFAYHGEFGHKYDGADDLEAISLRLSRLLVGPLLHTTGSPDHELARVLGTTTPPTPLTPARPAPAKSIYQLKVTLLDTKPPVWRRVLVDGDSTLDQLHEVIQAAFGWWNYHLHDFEIGPTRYGVPDPDDWQPVRDERRARLAAVAKQGTSFRYTYDFGDNWSHQITVEQILPATPDTPVPACVAGRRACPPEDCGGPWGYQELLAILADPTHPEHDERLEWVGSPFDPDAFDPGDFDHNLDAVRPVTFDD